MKKLLLPLFSILVACGGGDDDGGGTPDGGGNNANCTEATPGAQEFVDVSGQEFIAWSSVSDVNLDGGELQIGWEFYGGIAASLEGTFDLTAGPDDNYATCAVCVRAFSLDAEGQLARQFFQSGGTITLTADPLTSRTMVGTMTDVSLVEVEINPETFESTPVNGGSCIALGASVALNATGAPTGWTCDPAGYADGATCDCACGVADPDCDDPEAPINGCAGEQICLDAACTDTCDVLGGTGCETGTCGFLNATTDVCYTDAALIDAASLGETCAGADALFCDVDATIAQGVCDIFFADDGLCREACDDPTDCTTPGDNCSAVVGTKGMCFTPPVNDTCATALPLTVGGAAVEGSTTGGVSNTNAGLEADTCTGFAQAGADVMYSVVLTAGQAITATVTPGATFDPSLALLGPGAATVCDGTVTCLVGADAGLDGEAETFDFTATDAGTYFLIVDAFGATDVGTFTIEVVNQ